MTFAGSAIAVGGLISKDHLRPLIVDVTTNTNTLAAEYAADASGQPNIASVDGAAVIKAPATGGVMLALSGTGAENNTCTTRIGLLYPIRSQTLSDTILGYVVQELEVVTWTLGTATISALAVSIAPGTSAADLWADTAAAAGTVITAAGGRIVSPATNTRATVYVPTQGATHVIVIAADGGTATAATVWYGGWQPS